MSDRAFALKKPVEWISFSRAAGRASAKSIARRYRVKSFFVTALTRSSVHCAERMVAARSSSGVVKWSSMPASGYALASRVRILAVRSFFACAESAMTVGLRESRADQGDAASDLVGSELLRLVHHPPHGPAWLRITRKARHEMPVDVGHLIAEQLVVHLHGLVHAVERPRDAVHVLDQRGPLARLELVELDGVALEDHEDPSGEELVFIEVHAARGQVG